MIIFVICAIYMCHLKKIFTSNTSTQSTQYLTLINMSKTYFNSINKIWSGSKMPTIYNSNCSVGYLILNILQNSPDAITQVSYDSGIELTCRQMYQKTINIASYLQRTGCKPGDIVGFLTLNSDNLAATVFACLTLGLPINGLSPVLSESEIILFFSITKPKFIFCDADNIEKIQRVVKELTVGNQIFTVDRKVDGFEFIGDMVDHDCDADTFIIPQINADTVAFILATSGTTNHPKQVCKSHKGLIADLTVQWKLKLSSKEIWFGFTGIDWVSGIWTIFKGTFYCAKRIITTQKFDPNLMLEIIAKYNVTTTIIIPPLLASLIDCKPNPLSSMRVIIVGGLTVPKVLCTQAKLLFPNCKICPTYGSTEGGILAMNQTNCKLESVGQLYGNVEMKILNEHDNPLGVGEIGEIVYKTPAIFPGYFNDLQKTIEVIKDGWVFSGDLGYFDQDGNLFITDRKTDVLHNVQTYVSPSELEAIINEISGVKEVCVVGAAEEYGLDIIFAFVIRSTAADINEKFIEDYVSARVIDAKKIRGGVHFVDSFPLSINGKVRRYEIRKWAQEIYNNMKAEAT